MAGGTFKTVGDKLLPGAYVNVQSKTNALLGASTSKGTVFIPVTGEDWGTEGAYPIHSGSDFKALFGKGIEALPALYQVFKAGAKVVAYSFGGSGKPASGSNAVVPWSFKASKPGALGNQLSVLVQADPTEDGFVTVQYLLGTEVMSTQTVSKASQLEASAFITPTVKEEALADDGVTSLQAISSPVTVQLDNGGDSFAVPDYEKVIEALATTEFNVATNGTTDPMVSLFMAEAIKDLRENEGRKVQGVFAYKEVQEDHEGIITVANGVILDNGQVIDEQGAAAYVAGLTAVAESNESLTYRTYPNAVDVTKRYSKEQRIKNLKNGVLTFIAERGAVKIESDINSLHTFTGTKNQEFAKNRVVRVLDEVANNTRQIWEDSFVGKVTNNAEGRELFKSNRVEYLSGLQAKGSIQNFETDDITVIEGNTKDQVVVTIAIQPTDAMEKLYTTITVE